jgi:hypothetical protein
MGRSSEKGRAVIFDRGFFLRTIAQLGEAGQQHANDAQSTVMVEFAF